MCHDSKELNLKLLKNPMVGVAKLNLVSMDQMNNGQIVEGVPLEELKRTHGEDRQMGLPQKPQVWDVGEVQEWTHQ
jgi:hypothetical protein